jgi:4-hydroxy-tetrahydrodipicolinate reductase
MVIGATGHSDDALGRIREAAGRIPILKAANFSVGINVILSLVTHLTKELGEAYDVEVVEGHHRDKPDAPSGTALALVDELLAARGRKRGEPRNLASHPRGRRQSASRGLQSASSSTHAKACGAPGAAAVSHANAQEQVVFGRHGRAGRRPAGQIGVHSLRLGGVIGWHEVHFSGLGETVTVRHTTHSREMFAAGALRAAAWIVGKRPGLYTLGDVIGQSEP